MAKLPANCSTLCDAAMMDLTLLRNSSTACERARSSLVRKSGFESRNLCGKRLGLSFSVSSLLISLFKRRTNTCSTRSRSESLNSLVCVKRTGSRISRSPEKLRVWPLCGVAVKNSLCSKRGLISRSAFTSWLSSPKGEGRRLCASSTISRSHGSCAFGPPLAGSGVWHVARNCWRMSGCRR